jgi:hypothetical protein
MLAFDQAELCTTNVPTNEDYLDAQRLPFVSDDDSKVIPVLEPKVD